MATFIDITFFEALRPLFVFLIIFAIVYAILSGTRLLGDSKNVHAIIAFVIGLIMMISGKVTQVIMVMIPWFVVITIFFILLMVALKAFGAQDEGIMNAVENPNVYYIVAIIAVILLVASIAAVFGKEEISVTSPNETQLVFTGDDVQVESNGDPLDTTTGDIEVNAKRTIYHPRMLGFIVMIIITLFAVNQLTRT